MIIVVMFSFTVILSFSLILSMVSDICLLPVFCFYIIIPANACTIID